MSADNDEEEFDQAAIIRYVIIMILLLAAGGGLWLKRAASKQIPSDTVRVESNADERPADPTSSPINAQIGAKTVTEDEVRHFAIDWLQKVWQAEGLTPQPAGIALDKWRHFAHATISAETNAPDAPSHRALSELALELLPVAGEHPVSAYVVAKVLAGHPSCEHLLVKAAKGLSGQTGSEVLAFHVAAALATLESQEETTKTRTKEALAALRRALDAEGGFAEVPDRLCTFVLMTGTSKAFFDQEHEAYWTEVSKTEKIKPWLKKWTEGMHCLASAWDARGGGYSRTVSDDGDAIFKHDSVKAMRLFKEAWDLKPEDPAPAINSIYGALSGCNTVKSEMQHWFGESLKLQVDAPEASQHVLWGLRPRWFGSHREMEEFGSECMKTGRYDSALPWVLLQAHRDCASEWDVPDAYFPKLSSYSQLKALFDGAEKEPKREAWRSVDRTQAAICCFKCAQYDDAQTWLKKLDFKPNERVLAEWEGVDQETLIGKSSAFSGPGGDKFREAESAELAMNPRRAAELYRTGLASADGLSKQGRAFVDERICVDDIETKIGTNAGVSLLPKTGFVGWSHSGGGWKIVDGIMEHSGKESIHRTTCQARTGTTFTTEAELEIIEPNEPAQAWIALGFPEHDSDDRWIALRFAWAEGKTRAMLSNQFGAPLENHVLEVKNRFKFTLNASPNGLTLKVDDRPVFENVPVPDDYVNDDWSQLGIGAATKGGQTRIRLHALSIHR